MPRVFPVALAGFAAFLNLYATQPLLPLLMEVFGATHVAVSLTITASTVAVAIAAPAVGRLADSIGRKRVIVWSAATLAGATALAATSATLPQFIAWRFVQGLVTPGVFAITIAYIHEQWPATHVGRTLAAYVSGTVVGGFCGRAVAGLTAAPFGWRTAFLALAAMNVAAAAAVWAWLPPERAAVRAEPTRGRQPLVRLLRNRRLAATYGVGFCVLFAQVAIFTYVTFHLAAPPYSLSTAALGWLFIVYLAGAAVMPAAGRWIDAHGHRAGLAGGIGIGGAGAVLTLFSPLPLIVVGLASVATGVFVAQATASSYIGTATAEDRGLAVGLYATFYYAGGSLGAAVPGLFWARGGWPACVALVMGVQLLTIALGLTFWRSAT